MVTTRRLLAGLVLCGGISAAASAQDSGVDVGQLRNQIRTGDTVYITEGNGRETRIRDAGAAELERLFNELSSRAQDVRIEIERSDSLWNGTLLGLAVAGTGTALKVDAGPAVSSAAVVIRLIATF